MDTRITNLFLRSNRPRGPQGPTGLIGPQGPQGPGSESSSEYIATETVSGTTASLIEEIQAYEETTEYVLQGEMEVVEVIVDGPGKTYFVVKNLEVDPDTCDRVIVGEGKNAGTWDIADVKPGGDVWHLHTINDLKDEEGGYFIDYYDLTLIVKLKVSNATGLSQGTKFNITGSDSSDGTYTFQSESNATGEWLVTTSETITPSGITLGGMYTTPSLSDMTVNHGLESQFLFIIVQCGEKTFADVTNSTTGFGISQNGPFKITDNNKIIVQLSYSGASIGDPVKVYIKKLEQ